MFLNSPTMSYTVPSEMYPVRSEAVTVSTTVPAVKVSLPFRTKAGPMTNAGVLTDGCCGSTRRE